MTDAKLKEAIARPGQYSRQGGEGRGTQGNSNQGKMAITFLSGN